MRLRDRHLRDASVVLLLVYLFFRRNVVEQSSVVHPDSYMLRPHGEVGRLQPHGYDHVLVVFWCSRLHQRDLPQRRQVSDRIAARAMNQRHPCEIRSHLSTLRRGT